MEPQQFMEKFEIIMGVLKDKWSNSKIIILHETGRLVDIQYYTKGHIFNMLVRQHYHGSGSRTMMINGDNLLNADCVDLNDCGTSLLAASIKKALHD